MRYEFNFILDKEQYKKALKEGKQIKRKIQNKKVYRYNLKIATAFLIMLFAAILFASGFNINLSAVILLIYLFLLLILAKFINNFQIYKMRQKKYLDNEQQVIVTDEGVEVKTVYYRICYEWGFIKDAAIVSEYVFIVNLEDKVIIIPKIAFKENCEMNKLCKFVKQNIKNINYKNQILLHIKSLGGEIQHCERAADQTGPFYTKEAEKYIYKFQYKINNELKEGWVRFGTPHGADWKL